MNLGKMYKAKDLRDNNFALLRRVERQIVADCIAKEKKKALTNGFSISSVEKPLLEKEKNKFKNGMLFEKTKTKLGVVSRRR